MASQFPLLTVDQWAGRVKGQSQTMMVFSSLEQSISRLTVYGRKDPWARTMRLGKEGKERSKGGDGAAQPHLSDGSNGWMADVRLGALRERMKQDVPSSAVKKVGTGCATRRMQVPTSAWWLDIVSFPIRSVRSMTVRFVGSVYWSCIFSNQKNRSGEDRFFLSTASRRFVQQS
jgi:hypothetical protein